MITITTGDGKFFFSDFINLLEEQSVEVDEETLDLRELQHILSAFLTKRVFLSEEDELLIRDRITILTTVSGGGGGEIDIALLGLKEDKSNKITSITGSGSNFSYPSSGAVIGYVTGQLDSFRVSLALDTYVKTSELTPRLATKADKLVEVSPTALDVPVSLGIPLYTLDTGGEYVLCEPDSWVDIGNGLCIPAYRKNKLQGV